MEQLDSYLTQLSHTLLSLPRRPLEEIAQALWDTY